MLDQETKERTAAQRVTIIEALRDAGEQGKQGHELRAIAPHFTARMSELYGKGYDIKVERINSKQYRYILISEPKEETKQPKPLHLVLSEIEQHGGTISDEDMLNIFAKHKLHIVRRPGALKVGGYNA